MQLVPYDLNWPTEFEAEAKLLRLALGDNYIAVHHVGSTSVPGLAAKPRIDVLVVVQQRLSTIEKLEPVGYEYRGEFNIPLHYGFRKRGKVDFNLHVYEEDHADIESLIKFRDYLREHSSARDEYAALKQNLLESESSFEKTNSIYAGYTLGKNNFICNILDKSGFNRLRFMKCTHYTEWDAAKTFRQRSFFDKVPISDPYTWTFTHPDHMHFVLYKGTKIIGYAHIQLWPAARAALRIIVVDEPYRSHGYGANFLQLIEKWLKEQGYRSIHIESSPEALLFYKKHNYVAMPFDDPEGHTNKYQDIPLGKIL